MKANEIKVGSVYVAKVSGRLTDVRVDAIRFATDYTRGRFGLTGTFYEVTNLDTGRKLVFRSAAKFRREATNEKHRKIITAKPNTTQFGSPQSGFPEDGGTVGGPSFLPETEYVRKKITGPFEF